MMQSIRLLWVCLYLFIFIGNNSAQKIGHLNSIMLIDSLPEAKKLSEQAKIYEAALVKTGEEMVAKFQENYKKYQLGVQAGNLTALQQKEMEGNLEIEQNALENYRQSAQESLSKRKQELSKPLMDKINMALKEIGKEGNFLFIFDSSVSILYSEPSLDVFDLVYKKLNP